MNKKPKNTPETLRKKNKSLAEKVEKMEALIEDIKTARMWSETRLQNKLEELEKSNEDLSGRNQELERLIKNTGKVRTRLENQLNKLKKEGPLPPAVSAAAGEKDVNGKTRELEKAFQKRKELERIISDSPAIVFLWHATEGWPIEFVSDNIRQFGYRPEDFYFRRLHYASIVHPDDLERMVTDVNRYNREGRVSFIQEYRIITRSGDVRWLEDHTWVRRDASGVITHYQGILLDITERKKAAEGLLQAEKMAAIGTMAASVAHELRSPLGVIKLAVDNIDYRLKKKDEKLKMSISYIDQKVWEATKIINDLLNYSRLGEPVLVKTDVNALAEEALSNVIIDFPDHDAEIVKNFGKVPGLMLDHTQMRGVLQNIIKNAFEAMEKDGKLTLTTKFVKHANKAEISVTDNGCGIAENNIEKLNKPFFSTKVKGIGLGLALSFRIVKENHKGEIAVKSKLKKGTTFTVKLPL
ncbi:MAG: ATP-binding protein [Candidatus Omnitrophota bacterium]|nr:ATP-binding protein [Candidatus Omnitrophota bacterium]